MPEEQPETRFDFTRRSFLGQSGLAGGIVLSGHAADVARGEVQQQDTQNGDTGVDEDALVQLDINQARLVQAMAERIYPSDEFGPGAVETGVVYFIDRQLAGAWGQGENWYMEPPFVNQFEDAIPNQGWQSNLTPVETYEFALEWTEEYANNEFGGSFLDLSTDQQDELLTALENDEPNNFRSVKPSEFFTLFRTNVLEGVYCDPTYGGNRNMAGWRMKRFPGSPGALGSYKELIGRKGFIRIPPQGVEDDVESTGIETGTGSSESSNSSESTAHSHGPRYEMESEQDDAQENDAHGNSEGDTDA
ncbi:gluconate 2-dehydrogenase subunit 3 family protein [Haladaptatus cibarius]|uniref:gluconate 2-dehydrogenase subunit 3 family protein n=1 Tax=Haladaptatus cibarius TaxID=453847 RepID=UPI0006789439|nr:gluconate 2-dehydrogenase subunit 3 family protein [Haladaptatus cibarius]